MIVRYSPIPTPVASLILAGIALGIWLVYVCRLSGFKCQTASHSALNSATRYKSGEKQGHLSTQLIGMTYLASH